MNKKLAEIAATIGRKVKHKKAHRSPKGKR